MATSDIFNLTDTWNAGATTFTAIKMNVTDTASASASLLLDLQVGGSSQFSVSKSGQAIAADGTAAAPALRFSSDSGMGFYRVAANTLGISFSGALAHVLTATSYRLRANSGLYTLGTSDDVLLSRAAAASLQLGAADAAAPVAQTLGVQSVVAGTTNTAGTNFTIKGSAGTGTGAGGSIIFQVAPAGSTGTAQNAFATALTIATTAITAQNHLLFSADNTYDIGASGANRPRDFYLGRNFTGSGFVSGSYFRDVNNRFHIYSGSTDGTIVFYNQLESDFGRMMFGGTTSSFPALKRSSTTLQARLADDSAYAPIQGKLTTDTAYTAGSAGAATGYIVIYDSTGTAYKVEARV